MIFTKVCQRCEQERPVERFRKCRYTTDGLTHKCKDCVKMPPRWWGIWLGVITSQKHAVRIEMENVGRFWKHSGRPGVWVTGTHFQRPNWFKATRASGTRMACKLIELRTATVLVNTLDLREMAWVSAQTFPELEEARAEWAAWRAAHPNI